MSKVQLREVASGLRFPEGPVVMKDGSVLVTELQGGRIVRVARNGKLSVVAECGGGGNGAAFGPDGALYVCNNGGFNWVEVNGVLTPMDGLPTNYAGGKVQRVELESGRVETLYTECDGRQLRAPNDLVFDRTGNFWFTDFGWVQETQKDRCGIYYARPDGSLIEEKVFPIDGPNGIGLAPDGETLYAAQTFEGRIWQWDLAGPGAFAGPRGDEQELLSGPGGGRLLVGLPGYQLLDSMAVDSDGNICVATLINGGISVISPRGDSVEHIPMPDPITTNICFGGQDLMTAYITLTTQGKLVEMKWPRPGLPLAYEG